MAIAIDGRSCLSSVEAGARLRKHPAALVRKVALGKLKAHRLQGRLYFDEADIEELASTPEKGNGRN